MLPVRACFTLFSVLAMTAGCHGSPATGAGGSPAGTGGAASSSTGGTGGDGGTDPAIAQCVSCLDSMCSTEKAACNDECFALQACLDTICFNLSATGAADEGTCQLYCQNLHPAGKTAQLAWVNCVYAGTCQPPCAGYSYDYDQCVQTQTAGACSAALAACDASSDCKAYEACAGSCTTFDECQACGASTSGAAGEKLYGAYQLCLDKACFAQGWLPHA